MEAEERPITAGEKAEFQRQHKIVENGVEAFWEVGEALSRIKEGKLWRAGGFASWEDYCRSVGGMSRIHAHRLLHATEFMRTLHETLPRGNVLPAMEAQVRPILKLGEERRIEAWEAAVERAGGKQPTAPEVKQVVFEILHPGGTNGDKPASSSRRRVELAGQLRAAVRERKSWEEVERLVEELEKLLRPRRASRNP